MRKTGKSKNKKSNIVKIKVIGVGGGGGNAVSRMAKSDLLRQVELIAINTDAQDLDYCLVKKKIYIGESLTKGLGTGMNPELGRQAAEENRPEIAEALRDADLVFITAGFGGGTGTGAAPVVAEAAREAGALTVAVVTKPFSFEGSQRIKIAQEGLTRLKDKVDTLVIVPNDKIFGIIDKNTSLIRAFLAIDDVLRNAVQAVTELVMTPGLVNVDFADIKAIMKDAGSAIIGVGAASGADRSMKAITSAVNSSLLEFSIDGAKGALFCVSGRDIKMAEINEIAKVISEAVDQGAKIIFGAYYDRKLKSGQLKVTLIATGFNGVLNRPASSLFSFENDDKKAKGEPLRGDEDKSAVKTGKKDKQNSDLWDIPAFMRRRKR